MSETPEEPEHAADTDAPAELIRINNDFAVLLGSYELPGIEVLPTPLLGSEGSQSFAAAVQRATGLGNLGAQLNLGIQNATGLVRLTPETLKDLERLKPLKDGAKNLGVLADKSGKITKMVRWTSATGPQAAQIASSAGVGLALMAIQAQLGRIEKAVQKSIEVSNNTLAAVEEDQRSRVTGLHAALRHELTNAQAIGAVTESIWRTVDSHASSIGHQLDLFRERVRRHVRDIEATSNVAKLNQLLTERGQVIVQDAHLLLLLHEAWMIYQLLRVGSLASNTSPENHALALHLSREAENKQDALLDELRRALHQLKNALSKSANANHGPTIPLLGKARAIGRLEQLTSAIVRELDTLDFHLTGIRTDPWKETALDIPEEITDALQKRVQPQLAHDEVVVAVGSLVVRPNLARARERLVILTNQRVMYAEHEALLKRGTIRLARPWTELEIGRASFGFTRVLKFSDQEIELLIPDEITTSQRTRKRRFLEAIDELWDVERQRRARAIEAKPVP